ncbi:hypothetical protein ACHMWN_08875 [Pedobacter sp. UC225_61]|uniref:hypothetical protein n=1 Tax=Pedobacter sp. UC225_61 TaxID=3374623 RepID=UPI003787C9F2
MEGLERLNYFGELVRIKLVAGYTDQQANLANAPFTIKGEWVVDESLYRFLEFNRIAAQFLASENGIFLVDKLLVQYILIDKLVSDGFNGSTLKEVNESLKEIPIIYKPLLNWNDSGIVIAYLHQMGLAKWGDFVSGATIQWNNFNALDRAMSQIELASEDIFIFIKKLQSTDAFAGGVHKVSTTLSKKLLTEPKLAAEFESSLEIIIADKELRKFLTAVIVGLSGKNGAQFTQLLDAVKDKFEGEILFQLFWGFIRCCPDDLRSEFEKLMKSKFDLGKLSKPQYLQLCGQFKSVSPEIALLVVQPLQDGDFVGIYEYLYDLTPTENKQTWYKEAALSLYTSNNPEHRGQLDFLLYNLSEHNLEIIYDLLTVRFENLGVSLFLGEHLDHIISLNQDLFQLNLTKWFNSPYANVHKAMLKVCSGRHADGVSKLSSKYFKTLSTEEKVFICYKIAGFVYSMENLQSLLFSVLDASEEDDETLLVNLEHIFKDYLVYNYRSTLDIIKVKLDSNDCLMHHKEFLAPIVETFEQYFTQLNKVRMFNELRADSKLEELLRFYKHQLFSESMKESNKKGFLSMIKSVNLHAKKWAIRREGEKIHKVDQLGLIEHSFEFPSGEKLDPTYQESLRRNYQRIQKHEINFS